MILGFHSTPPSNADSGTGLPNKSIDRNKTDAEPITWSVLVALLSVWFLFLSLQSIAAKHWALRPLLIAAAITAVYIWSRKRRQQTHRNAEMGINFPPHLSKFLRFCRKHGSWFLFFLVIIVGARSVWLVYERDRIRLDQGETSYNAARLLAHAGLKDGNPYGRYALVDHTAYWQYHSEYAPNDNSTYDQVTQSLKKYFLNFDPQLYQSLLPNRATNNPPSSDATTPAANWTHPLGYKYGPVIFGAHFLTVPLLGRGAVMVLNTVAYLIYLWAMARVIRHYVAHQGLALFVLWLVATEPNTRGMLGNSATDIYPLAFIALAWWGWLCGRGWLLGGALGLAVMSKIAPTVMALPLLALPHPLYAGRKIVAATVTLIGVAGIFCVPFILADAQGFVANYLLWPLAMEGDGSGWSQFYSHTTQQSVRFMALGCIALSWLMLYWRQYRHYVLPGRGENNVPIHSVALAVYCFSLGLIWLSGSVLHSNYFTWAAGFALIYVASSQTGSETLAIKGRQPAGLQPIPAAE
ncbi:MAG: glycosyltransferase 87 family protein [Alphaproteobacteria bacterium]|nr:glycosyltransferase 87 family protein [Alphaproteobacteria bacterium]